jgi:toxic protein SymE
VPWIQLKGYWLQQAGFEINTPLKVRVMPGCLVLTVEEA